MRLNKTLARHVTFTRFCTRLAIDPTDVAELCMLAERAARAGVRNANEGTISSDRAEKAAGLAFGAKARELGYDVEWPGLYPNLVYKGVFHPLPLD